MIYETQYALYDVQLDIKHQFIYFNERSNDAVYKISYDGTGLTLIRDNTGTIGALSANFDNDVLYWIERQNYKIVKTDLNGNNKTEVIYQSGSQIAGQDISKGYQQQPLLLKNNPPQPQLIIYPNPCKDYFYLDSEENSIVSIYNVSGQLVAKTNVEAGEPVDVSKLVNGTYIVVCDNGKSITNSKIVVKND